MTDYKKLEVLRHSTSHIMALAVKKIYPDVKIAIGPSIEDGFYYDFDTDTAFTPEDLVKIEDKMKEIIEEDPSFVKREVSKEEALGLFNQTKEIYKIHLLNEIPEDKVTLYQTGDFIDLCKGPHIESAKEIKAFKLLAIAGAYWRGNEKNKMLQRIYGTAFFSKGELDDHLSKLEEAKLRDHRKLGKELELFSFHEEIGGPGLVYWHPKGARIRRIIEDFWIEEHFKRGYQYVYTPHIAKIDLWKTSGHLEFFKDNMYSPMDIDGDEYLLKPMNCPFHILIYKTKKRSYRELPLRWAELGTVYRYERSGVLHGMLRLRGFTQDDAHIFCTPEQLLDEMLKCVNFAIYLLKIFGFENYEVFLSTRSQKFAGTQEQWDTAEATLAEALKGEKIDFSFDEGGAVFYGPKIDIKIKDALGKFWQGPTIQLDFNLPSRFNVNYTGTDGKEHFVYMVHRAMLGSFERFFACLIEHYGGAFPLWLSPVQAVLIPIAQRHISFCKDIESKLLINNIRIELDARNEKVGFKIRDAQLQKIPYMLVIGDKEVQDSCISVRSRKEPDLGKFNLDDFVKKIKDEVERKM